MPTLALPVGLCPLSAGVAGQSQTAPFSAGLAGALPFLIAGPRQRPRSRISIRRIYLPIAITTTGSSSRPTVCELQLSFIDGARLFWVFGATVQLIAGSNPGTASANLVVSEDAFNPIVLDPEDQPILQGSASFDQAINTAELYACYQNLNPDMLQLQQSPGIIHFDLGY